MKFLSFIYLVLGTVLVVEVSSLEVLRQRVVVNASELCILPLTPSLFKWEKEPGYMSQVEYIPKLSNSPDLPEWLKYTYDAYTSTGYIYGVPPVHLISLNLDIVAWNKDESYDVRKLIVSMEIMRKDSLKYVMELKVDNLNVKELAVPRRMQDLINVLSDQLSWIQNDGSKVVPVFMASAVELGENRVPLRPSEAEGVVVHFGSDLEFSPELEKLQVEVQPLWKLRPCPRDLKRTSVERHFRRFRFLVDWCSLRLSTLVESTEENKGKDLELNKRDGESGDEIGLSSEPLVFHFRSEIPQRFYRMEILLSTIIPGSIGGLVGFLLIILLRTDRDEDASIDEDTLFFEAAFRMLLTMLRYKDGGVGERRNGSQYSYRQAPQQDVDIVLVTQDQGPQRHSEDRAPIPPQYADTHPNGAPALIYAV